MRKLLICLIALAVLAGCDRSFALFPLVVETDDGATEVALRENPGRPPEEEGFLVSPDEPLRLVPDTAVPEPAGESMLVVRLSGVSSAVSLDIRDSDGELVLRTDLTGSTPVEIAARPVAIGVALPGEREMAEFAFTVDEVPDEPVRILGLSVVPLRPGAGTVAGSDDALFVSPGTRVTTWTPNRGEWSVDNRTSEAWPGDAPVEIRYHFTPARRAEEALLEEIEPAVGELTVGPRSFEFRLRPGANRVILYPQVEGISVDSVEVATTEPDVSIDWIGPVARPPRLPSAVPVDFGTLMRYPAAAWRSPEFELFAWTLYPRILVFDTLSYEVQARFFRRLAYFVEKIGYRGTVLTDGELEGRHGYNAHNYNAVGLADFFTAAQEQEIDLTEEEILLREIVVAHGVVIESEQGYLPGEGGVLSVSQESTGIPTLRELLLSHEAYHGVYYAEPAYVAAIDELWESLDEAQRRYWRLLLSGLRYDVEDEYLVRNEYHAYLLQQRPQAAEWYFGSRSADRIARWFPASAQWLENYLEAYRGTHREQAARAQAALYTITGLLAADVSCLEPLE